MGNKKIAILFYGLTKSLNRTIQSIQENIFTPLVDSSIDYDIFIHVNKINGEYQNEWTRERTDNYENANVEELLNPKYYISENQEDIIAKINFNDYYKKLGNWTGMSEEMTKYLISNLCLALYSKSKITELFEEHKEEYDYAMIIRPDLFITNKLDTNILNNINNSNIIIPEQHWFHGVNDRLCIGTPDIILKYGKLFYELQEYSEKKSIIAEVYLMDKLREKNIHILKSNISYDMVRL